MPSAIPCSLSPLTSRIHTCLFSDWSFTVSSKFFDPQVSSVSTEELVLSRHTRDDIFRLRCNGNSLLLGSCITRIDRIESPSCSACGHRFKDISDLILHYLATDSLATLCLSTTFGPGPVELPDSRGSMVFRHAPSLERGRVTTTYMGLKSTPAIDRSDGKVV